MKTSLALNIGLASLGNNTTWVIAGGLLAAAGVIGLYRSLNVESASITAAFISLAPVLTALTEWLVLGGQFAWTQIMGIGLVVSGAMLLAVREKS